MVKNGWIYSTPAWVPPLVTGWACAPSTSTFSQVWATQRSPPCTLKQAPQSTTSSTPPDVKLCQTTQKVCYHVNYKDFRRFSLLQKLFEKYTKLIMDDDKRLRFVCFLRLWIASRRKP